MRWVEAAAQHTGLLAPNPTFVGSGGEQRYGPAALSARAA
jgi:hypothetical protein